MRYFTVNKLGSTVIIVLSRPLHFFTSPSLIVIFQILIERKKGVIWDNILFTQEKQVPVTFEPICNDIDLSDRYYLVPVNFSLLNIILYTSIRTKSKFDIKE
jgi:hypothetical protein